MKGAVVYSFFRPYVETKKLPAEFGLFSVKMRKRMDMTIVEDMY